MSETKFTLGPWKSSTATRYGPSGNAHYYQWWVESDTRKAMAVLEVPYLAKGQSESTVKEHADTLLEVEANAHLIAAAPELYEALDGMLSQLRQMFPGIEAHVQSGAGLKAHYMGAEIALRKARGEQP